MSVYIIGILVAFVLVLYSALIVASDDDDANGRG